MRIDLLGTSFSVRTDEDPRYLQEVVEYFRGKVDEVRSSGTTGDPLKLAILAGILASDDYLKSIGSARSDRIEVESVTRTLIDELDQALDTDAPRHGE
ncbi:MAG: cell division protein ZapA [Spirochaetales bacterium]